MRTWNLSSNYPLTFTLAADSRLTTPDYLDDQIWEFSLSSGNPASIRLFTNFGLRCRSFHLFPRFIEGNTISYDPFKFPKTPVVRQFYPNLISLNFSPFPEIDVEIDYWVPLSKAIASRIKFTNRSDYHRQIRLEWHAILIPGDDGEPMAPMEIEAVKVLVGRSNKLIPLVFLTGGTEAKSGSNPALSQLIDLKPHINQEVILSHAALSTPEASFDLAREIAARNWEAENARIDLHNSGEIEIYTGDPDWDVALALSQKYAYNLFTGPTDHLPERSFLLSRKTDQGYSLTGDGQDYGHMWNGQSAYDAYILSNLILPTSPDLAQGLIRNFIYTQIDNGFIDWKPGLSGQKSNILATPILATLTWRIHQFFHDEAFLLEVFPHLLAYIYTWFSSHHDRDGDGIPEWDNPLQAGIEDHPLFSRWHRWAQGLDISSVETPLLCSYLYNECQCLIKMAEYLSRTDPIPSIQSLADGLKAALDSSWNEEQATYQYWDRDLHTTYKPRILIETVGPGVVNLQATFSKPMRLILRIDSEGESTRRPNIFIHGVNQSGKHRVERITQNQFQWFLGNGHATSVLTYGHVEHIDIQGLDKSDKITVQTANLTYQDITLLMPLWACISSESQAEVLVKKTITDPNKYWREYGLPTFPHLNQDNHGQIVNQVNIPWNIFIGEGLLNYGYRPEAAILISRLMEAIIINLKKDGIFFQYYQSNDGIGVGDKNTLHGLAPVGLFLETLGVRILSTKRVAIEGNNPFPWKVMIKYRGLTIIRQEKNTQIIFSNDQLVEINDPEPRVISLD
jgi:hypothetical protein